MIVIYDRIVINQLAYHKFFRKTFLYPENRRIAARKIADFAIDSELLVRLRSIYRRVTTVSDHFLIV